MQRSIKLRTTQRFLAASALFLAIGGTAFAQATAPAAPGAAPAATPQAGGPRGPAADGRHHGGGMLMMADTDKDGAISKAEADALFDKMDANHDGKIDRAEMAAFHKANMEQRKGEMKAKFDADFKAADKNGDGALTKQEAQAGMPRLARHFDQLDTNHDGKLTQAEIQAGFEKMHKARTSRGPRGGDKTNPAVPATTGG